MCLGVREGMPPYVEVAILGERAAGIQIPAEDRAEAARIATIVADAIAERLGQRERGSERDVPAGLRGLAIEASHAAARARNGRIVRAP